MLNAKGNHAKSDCRMYGVVHPEGRPFVPSVGNLIRSESPPDLKVGKDGCCGLHLDIRRKVNRDVGTLNGSKFKCKCKQYPVHATSIECYGGCVDGI